MHWLIAPDSFKGSLSARAAAEAMARGVRAEDRHARVSLRAMADGGEGTLDALWGARGGEWVACEVADAAGQPKRAVYLRLPDGSVLIEVAQVVGLPDCPPVALAARSSTGVGQLLRHALGAGAPRIMLALGGSSTNDAGAGVLAALGARFLDARGQPLAPTPAALRALARVDTTALPDLRRIALEVWSDVDNPLCGSHGASAVFGPQKGMLARELALFDALHARVAQLCGASALAAQPGAGAAGGMGWALFLLGARQVAGAHAVAHALALPQALATADWVLTGEGHSDAQTLHGKAPFTVAQLARAAGVPVSLVSGALAPDADALQAAFDGCFSLCPGPLSHAQAMAAAAPLLQAATAALVRTILAARAVRR